MAKSSVSKKTSIGVPRSAVAAPTTVTAQDFFSGLIAALKLETTNQEAPQFRADKRLNEAILEAFVEFTNQAQKTNCRPLFHIKLDPVYGDSETISAGLASASGRNLIRFFNPTYAGFDLKLSEQQARHYLSNQQEGEKPYRLAAKKLLTLIS